MARMTQKRNILTQIVGQKIHATGQDIFMIVVEIFVGKIINHDCGYSVFPPDISARFVRGELLINDHAPKI